MKNALIYILDENAIQGNLLKYQLSCGGFQNIHHYASIEECLYAVHKNDHPDFIIIDPGTSGTNGLTFLQMVIQIDPSIKVIIFSSGDNEPDMRTFLNAGAIDYIVRNGNNQSSLRELISNLQFILKEKDQ